MSDKCIKCKYFLRGMTANGRNLTIKSREKAEKFLSDYGFYVQPGDIVCLKCYSALRKNKHTRISHLAQEQPILPPLPPPQPPPPQPPPEQSPALFLAPSESPSPLLSPLESSISQMPPPQSPLSQVTITESSNAESMSSSQSENVPSQQSSINDPTYTYVDEKPEINAVKLNFSRVVATHGYCFICQNKEDLRVVPFDARMQTFVKKRIFIPRQNRICKSHLIKDRFYDNELDNIQVYADYSLIEVTEVESFLSVLCNDVNNELHEKIGKYAISEERVKVLTGYTWENIEVLKEMLSPLMRNSKNQNITQAIVIFLFKMRSGSSDSLIAASLGVDESVVCDSINAVLKRFKKNILPDNFGITVNTRQMLINNSSEMARSLHDLENRVALICDGTYLRHGKSSNNSYQRDSYSGQKKTSLCKPFTICTTNGYIVDLCGPYKAKWNDAKILRLILEDPDGVSSLLEKGDIFILDRGFRDVVPLLEEKGFIVLMPALKGKRLQLTTKEANESRLVTKVRWVVEAIHGIIGQKFKLLHHQLNNKLLPNGGLYSRIACYLVNKFGKRFASDVENVPSILSRMQTMMADRNTLAEEVHQKNWDRLRAPFQLVSSDELWDFPELTVADLKLLFTGSFQLRQAISYLAEIMREDYTIPLSFLKENPGVVKFEVQSRHINSKQYRCYVEYEPNSMELRGIKRYCCNCANGNRTIGCCSHVAAIIHHLSYARYRARIQRPAEMLSNLFASDLEKIDINYEVSDDEAVDDDVNANEESSDDDDDNDDNDVNTNEESSDDDDDDFLYSIPP